MKIIRYVNGKKVEPKFWSETVVSNTLISGTIARVNERVFKTEGKDKK